MTVGINQIARGMALKVDETIYVITEYSHVKPGKGTAFARVKLKNVENGLVVERTYKTADKLEDIPLEERKMQYLYTTGSEYHFMDQVTFEEHVLTPEEVGADVLKFLLDDMEVTGLVYNEKVLRIDVPMFIITEVTQTDPGLKGDSSRAGTKPAQIATGATFQVPLFIGVGDRIRIDTRTGDYIERAKE